MFDTRGAKTLSGFGAAFPATTGAQQQKPASLMDRVMSALMPGSGAGTGTGTGTGVGMGMGMGVGAASPSDPKTLSAAKSPYSRSVLKAPQLAASRVLLGASLRDDKREQGAWRQGTPSEHAQMLQTIFDDIDITASYDPATAARNSSEHMSRGLHKTSYIPILTRFECSPSYTELLGMNFSQLQAVRNFCLWNKWGSVEWPGLTDLTYLNIDEIVSIGPGSVIVYPDDCAALHKRNTKLNKKAIITVHQKNDLSSEDVSKLREAFSRNNIRLRHCDASKIIFTVDCFVQV